MNAPPAPFWLGFAGLIPFVWGALTVLVPDIGAWGTAVLGPRFAGPYVVLFYGAVILSFMSGVLWGFATRLSGPAATAGYGLSVVPALWAFFTTGGGVLSAGLSLIAGFTVILGIDWWFARQGVAPGWWMPLRLALTAVVLVCLAIAVLFS
jgi:hypothetical protein